MLSQSALFKTCWRHQCPFAGIFPCLPLQPPPPGAASRSLQQDAAADPRIALVDTPTEALRRHKGYDDYHKKKEDYSKKRRYDDKEDYEPHKLRPRPDPRPDPPGPINTAGPNNAIFEGPTIPDP